MPTGKFSGRFPAWSVVQVDCLDGDTFVKFVDGTGRLTGQVDYREKLDARVWCHVGMAKAYRLVSLDASRVTDVSLDVPGANGGTTKELERQIDLLAQDVSPFVKGHRYYSPVTYFWPDYYNGATSKWNRTLGYGSSLGVVIMNRNSGDWETFDADFHKQAARALSAGAKRCVFYVKTQYGVADLPKNDPARAGVPDVDKYTQDYILQQIAWAKKNYPNECQGVFLDEVVNGWGAQAPRLDWYRQLFKKIRDLYGKQFLIVINTGSNIADVFVSADFDICMCFEEKAETYLKNDATKPVMTDRMMQEPATRWWHVIHDVTKDNYQKVVNQAASLDVAHLYITDGQLVKGEGGQWKPEVNPYQNPPSDWLMPLTIAWVNGYLDILNRVIALEAKQK
nr:MAG TPA: Spherulation-specific family 4 [Caudoviricetes sp.]